MYKITSLIIETIKTFCISILCSVIFSLMIYRENVLFSSFACFILNFASIILFLFLYYKNWVRTYTHTFSNSDYWVPALVSFVIFCGVSSCLYVLKAGDVFRWLFQQTRFLEPVLNKEYKFISFIVSQLLFLLTLVVVPVINSDRT